MATDAWNGIEEQSGYSKLAKTCAPDGAPAVEGLAVSFAGAGPSAELISRAVCGAVREGCAVEGCEAVEHCRGISISKMRPATTITRFDQPRRCSSPGPSGHAADATRFGRGGSVDRGRAQILGDLPHQRLIEARMGQEYLGHLTLDACGASPRPIVPAPPSETENNYKVVALACRIAGPLIVL